MSACHMGADASHMGRAAYRMSSVLSDQVFMHACLADVSGKASCIGRRARHNELLGMLNALQPKRLCCMHPVHLA